MVSTSAVTLEPATLPRVPAGADRPFASRTAFLLNANARAVNERLTERLAEVVPAGDLFLSRSLDDAQVFARTIARRGYSKVFLGGGDGTVVTTVRLIQEACDQLGLQMPQVGVLKLGTGNALATALHALSPVVDAHHVVQRGPLLAKRVDMVEDEDGVRMPFAGMGYDGAVLNDYVWLKKKAHESGSALSPVFRGLAESVFGYLGAMLARTVPAHVKKKAPQVRITSSKTTYEMVSTPAGDVERAIPAGSVLYEGPAPVVSVGSIPFFGFGFTMFPFAGTKPGFMQLRVCAVPIPVILASLWPSVWKGAFRHEKLHDFLLQDVVIESDQPLPYQVGGDARGERTRLTFKVSERPLEMVELGPRLVPAGHAVLQLGPAKVMFKLP